MTARALYIRRRLCPLGQKTCQKGRKIFNGLKRESATLHSQKCKVALGNLHRMHSRKCKVALRAVNGSAFVLQSIDSKSPLLGLQNHQFCKRGANRRRVMICPLKRERPALVGFYGIDATEVVVRQVDTRTVRATFQHQALSVWRNFHLVLNERIFIHSKERRDARDFGIRDSHDSIFDATTRPTPAAFEPI